MVRGVVGRKKVRRSVPSLEITDHTYLRAANLIAKIECDPSNCVVAEHIEVAELVRRLGGLL